MKSYIKILLIVFFGGLISCSKTEENVPLDPPTAEISVDKLVRKASLRNQLIPFTIINEEGEDFTSIATFYVNGIAIEGNTFSSEVIGDFEVFGVYLNEGVETTTNTESFSVIIPKRKIIIEDYTGTWCGFCPGVLGAIESVEELTDEIAVVAIHETANSNPDPMHFPQVQDLKDMFGVDGLPAARINRTSSWSSPYDTEEVTGMAGDVTDFAISILSQLTDNELVVEVNIVYENGSVPGDKLVVYLVEDGIIYDQTNYFNADETSPFYQMGDPIPNFEHHKVLRKSISQLFGDAISSTSALETYSRTLSVVVSPEYNIDNLSLVAMVVSEDNTGKNAQTALINEDKEYE
jgi:thiol-disulfide isomerase/thioredoxin